MSKIDLYKGKDFSIKCAFSVPYKSVSNKKYLVDMESGLIALYSCTTSGYYGGTGQHDWNFKFIRYVNSSEIEENTMASVDPRKNYQQKVYTLKDTVSLRSRKVYA
jgi:hypothetical protein